MMVVKTVWKCKYCDFLSFCNDNEYHNDGCIGYGKLINQEWVCVDSLKKELSKLMSNHIMERRGKSNISYAKALDDVEVLFGEASNEKTSEEVPKTLITTLNCELCRFFPKKCRVYRARKYYPCSEFERS